METSTASIATGTREPKVLTRAEVEAFARNGYHFPVRALTARAGRRPTAPSSRARRRNSARR